MLQYHNSPNIDIEKEGRSSDNKTRSNVQHPIEYFLLNKKIGVTIRYGITQTESDMALEMMIVPGMRLRLQITNPAGTKC